MNDQMVTPELVVSLDFIRDLNTTPVLEILPNFYEVF